MGRASTVAQTARSSSICPNRRRAREFLVLVLVVVLVIGNGAIEDEDEDDLVAAWPRCAVSRVANPPQRSQRNAHLPPSAPTPTGSRRYSRHGCLRYNRRSNALPTSHLLCVQPWLARRAVFQSAVSPNSIRQSVGLFPRTGVSSVVARASRPCGGCPGLHGRDARATKRCACALSGCSWRRPGDIPMHPCSGA